MKKLVGTPVQNQARNIAHHMIIHGSKRLVKLVIGESLFDPFLEGKKGRIGVE
jgi:hypothetical protein